MPLHTQPASAAVTTTFDAEASSGRVHTASVGRAALMMMVATAVAIAVAVAAVAAAAVAGRRQLGGRRRGMGGVCGEGGGQHLSRVSRG